MKKNRFIRLVYVVYFFLLLIACENDGYHESDRLTANYSNKLADGDVANLRLTYSGAELIGKSVYFKTENTKTADMIFLNIVPGEQEAIIRNVVLTPVEGGYSFAGNASGLPGGVSFRYSGRLEKGILTLDVSEVRLPQNVVTSQRTWFTIPYTNLKGMTQTDPNTGIQYTDVNYGIHFYSDHSKVSSLSGMVESLGGNILGSVLRNVIFSEDGNITIRYASMPVLNNFLQYLIPLPIRPESDYCTSPLNLVSYYIKDNSFYVVPNIDMIVSLLLKNGATTTRNLSLEDWTVIYQLLNRWTTTGIRFNLVTDIKPEAFTGGAYIKHKGDLMLYLDKEEIDVLFKLLPLLKDLIPEGNMKKVLAPMLDTLISGLSDATVFELGVVLQKQYQVEIPKKSVESSFINSATF